MCRDYREHDPRSIFNKVKPLTAEEVLEQAKKYDLIPEGDECFTDDYAYEDNAYEVYATARIFYVIIDKETGERIKRENSGIEFGVVAFDSDGFLDAKEEKQ